MSFLNKNISETMKNLFQVIALFTLSIILSGFSGNSYNHLSFVSGNVNNSELNNFINEQKAPSFTLTDINNKKVSLSDFKGKVIILDFWATWCPPCRESIPDLIELQDKYKNKLVVIGISLDRETKPNVKEFVKDKGINYKILYATPEVVQAYGNINAIPTSFIINGKGFIVERYIGLTPKQTYIDRIDNLIK